MKRLISYDAVQTALIVIGGIGLTAATAWAALFLYRIYWALRCALGR